MTALSLSPNASVFRDRLCRRGPGPACRFRSQPVCLGAKPAGYGEELIVRLSGDLQSGLGRGFGRAPVP